MCLMHLKTFHQEKGFSRLQNFFVLALEKADRLKMRKPERILISMIVFYVKVIHPKDLFAHSMKVSCNILAIGLLEKARIYPERLSAWQRETIPAILF